MKDDSIVLVLFGCVIVAVLAVLGVTVYGLIIAFSASVVIGIVSLFVPPSFVIYGLCALFGANIPQRLAIAFGLSV